MGIVIPNPFTSHNVYVQLAIAIAELLAGTAIIVIATYLVSRLISRRLRRRLERIGFQDTVAILLGRVGWVAIWAIGIIALFYFYGIGLTPLAALVGVIGLAASLSLQQVLQNLVAGVYLLAERPFRIGDMIAVVGPNGLNHVGTVEDIQMRTTQLRSIDDEVIVVPNSAIFSGVITNRTVVGGHAVHTSVVFPRSLDLEPARQSVLTELGQTESVLRRPVPEFRVACVSKDTWTAAITFWAETAGATSDVVWAIGRKFPEAEVNAQEGTAQ